MSIEFQNPQAWRRGLKKRDLMGMLEESMNWRKSLASWNLPWLESERR